MPDSGLIGDFRILRPRWSADHETSVRWLSAAHAQAESLLRIGDGEFNHDAFRRSMERHIGRFGCGPESLASRGHDLEDFLHQDWERMRIFNLARDPRGAGMGARMDVFAEIAERMLDAFYPQDAEAAQAEDRSAAGGNAQATPGAEAPPAELIHVTCTGYVAPSAAQNLIVRRGWQERVGVMHAYHMGCYASMPALRMATAFLASPRSRASRGRIDIVHTEACTLHLDPSRHMPEQLVVQSLFADGHIRYSVRPDDGRPGLRLLGVHEEIVPGSMGAMGWFLGDNGMRMILAREVPELISGALKAFLRRLYESAEADAAEALAHGVFAVHPGGPRIIDKVAELIELSPHQVAHSRAVLKAYGNMSSATLPHVWAGMLADPAIPSGSLITSLAFGPGLTVYGALLRKA